MSRHTNVAQLSHTVQQTQEWLKELASRPPFETEDQAYTYLRAVLHAVRDRLTVDQAAHFSAQLPMLLRGVYWEGWRPALAPNDFRTADEFRSHVRESLGTTLPAHPIDLPAGVETVLGFLVEKIDPGELRHVTGQLPEPIRALFGQRPA